MSATYFTLLTQTGEMALANAIARKIPLNLTQLGVGDGNGQLPTPDTQQTKLVNERRRAPLNTLSADPDNPAQIIAEQVLPEDIGGWWIREIGLYDEHNQLIAVGNCPPTYKPLLAEGSGRTQIIRMVLIVSDTASVVLKIDPSVVLATRQYVDEHNKDVRNDVKTLFTEHVKSRNHPDATLTAKGFTQLSSATDSTRETLAATPKAVKLAMDNANGRVPAGAGLNACAEIVGDIAKDLRTRSGFFNASNAENGLTGGHQWKYYFNAAHSNAQGYNGVIGMDFGGNLIGFTAVEAGTFKGWKKIYHEGFKPTPTDVDAVSAKNGGAFQKPISAAYAGPFAWAEQYHSTAAFHNDFTTTQSSEYHPVIKQRATITGKNSWAFSLGTLVSGMALSFHLHMKGLAGQDVNYTFTTNGDFRAPASIGAGASGVLAGDGNLHGSVWGGWLSNWLHHNTVKDVRLGAVQLIAAWHGTGFGDEGGYVITGVVNHNRDELIDTLARRPLQKYIAGNWYTVASI